MGANLSRFARASPTPRLASAAPRRSPSSLLRIKLWVDECLMRALNVLLFLLARPILRLSTGRWPRRQELQTFRSAFAEGHHHLPRLFWALSHITPARFYLIDTMLLVCRNVEATPAAAAPHARYAGKPVAFMHIEKTAGTSVTSFLNRRYATVLIAPLARSAAAAEAQLRAASTRHFSLLHGHYDLPSIRTFAPERIVITFLREPASRILSAYYFWRSRQLSIADDDVNEAAVAAAKFGLLDFLRCDLPVVRNQIDNIYTRRLTGLYANEVDDALADNPFAALETALAALAGLQFVGIQERLDESLGLLCKQLGLVDPLTIPRINISLENEANLPEYFSPVPREPVTPDINTELERLTRLDRIVYGIALRQLEAATGRAAAGPV